MSEYSGLLQSFIDNAEETYDTLNRGKYGKVARALIQGQMENLDKITRNQFPLITPESMRADPAGVLQAALGNTPTTNMLGLAIKASHGSPHLFDEFDMSKVGTGEGAQSYGDGLYFAENFNSPVANYYADLLGGKNQDAVSNAINRIVHVNNGDQSTIRDVLALEGFDTNQLTPEIEQTIKTILSETDKATDTVSDAGLSAYRKLRELVPNEGNLYNVSLEWPDAAREAADPLGMQHFLDWDKPLSEQNSDIIERLNKAISMKPDDLRQLFKEYPLQDFQLGSDLKDIVGEHYMSQAGIPGIRYLDLGSRVGGRGRSNFVVFDDKIPRILERNGEPMLELLRKSLPEMTK